MVVSCPVNMGAGTRAQVLGRAASALIAEPFLLSPFFTTSFSPSSFLQTGSLVVLAGLELPM